MPERKTMEKVGFLRRLKLSSAPSARLLCFPWAGAGASVYRRLANEMPPWLEVLAIQLPGREDRHGESPACCLHQLVERILPEAASLLDIPLFFFGHSMGALLAYEVARQLCTAKDGVSLRLVAVSGHGAPTVPAVRLRPPRQSSDAELISDIDRLGGTSSQVLSQMKGLLLRVLRADYQMLDAYAHRSGPALACPISVHAGREDTEISKAGVEGWRNLTQASAEVHWYDGGHFYLFPSMSVLSRQLVQEFACRCRSPEFTINSQE